MNPAAEIPAPDVGNADNKGLGHVVWFDDQAADPAAECCREVGVTGAGASNVYNGFMDGRFRPVDSLSRYVGLPSAGDWHLAVYDPVLNNVTGSVLSWGMRVHVGPCERRYRWRKLEPPMAPPARYDASSVVLGHHMFVFAGRGESRHDDMWRFDRQTVTWQRMPIPRDQTPVRAPAAPLVLNIPQFLVRPDLPLGRAGVMTPWGVLTFGGRSPHAHHLDPPSVVRWNVLNDRWYGVNPPSPADRRYLFPNQWKNPNYNLTGEDHLNGDLALSAELAADVRRPTFPHRRVFAGMAFIGETGTRTRRRGVDGPRLVLYGGYNGAQVMNDLWVFHLREVLHEEELVALTNLHPDTGTGVLAGMGSGLNTSTNTITGFGTGNYTMADEDVPGGPLMNELFHAHCDYRMVPRSAADTEWIEGCLGTGSNVCGVEDILLRALCTRAYQSVGVV